MCNLARREARLAPTFHTAPLRRPDPSVRPFADESPLKLGQQRHHVKHRASGRGLGVNRIGQTLKTEATLLQIMQDVQEVADTPSQPVELPHDERVAGLQRFQATGEAGALHGRAGDAVVSEGLMATGLLQRRKLQRGVLIVGADAGVAIFQSSNLKQTSGTCNPLKIGRFAAVSKPTLCGTGAVHLSTTTGRITFMEWMVCSAEIAGDC